jgi:hypothetical protein
MERIAQLGIGPGAAFPWDDFGPEVQRPITGGVEAGKQAIHDQDELAPGPGRGPLQARAPALLTQAPGRPRLLATPSDRTRALGARHPAFRSAESGSGPPRTVSLSGDARRRICRRRTRRGIEPIGPGLALPSPGCWRRELRYARAPIQLDLLRARRRNWAMRTSGRRGDAKKIRPPRTGSRWPTRSARPTRTIHV